MCFKTQGRNRDPEDSSVINHDFESRFAFSCDIFRFENEPILVHSNVDHRREAQAFSLSPSGLTCIISIAMFKNIFGSSKPAAPTPTLEEATKKV
jgi:hypothetical protein